MQKAKVTIELVKNRKENIIFDHPFAPFNRESIVNQLSLFQDRFILHLDVGGPFSIPERTHPTLIMDSFFVATDCFLVQQFPATILFASITVETTLNHDSRLYDYRQEQKRKWINLTVENIVIAKDVGIDVSDLLEENDNGYDSEFVSIRNKVAHGDMSGYTSLLQGKIMSPKDIDQIVDTWHVSRKQALIQLKKSFDFIKKWGMSNPTIILDKNETIRFSRSSNGS